MRKIYLASSWRNEHQPRIVALLRNAGHEVYDFRHPSSGGPPGAVESGFSWREIDPEWERWTPEQYVAAMSHPAAVRGYNADKAGMDWADTCVVLQPCGPSSALEAGWCAGSGRDVVVHVPAMREPDLMYKLGRAFTLTDEALLSALAGPAPRQRADAPDREELRALALAATPGPWRGDRNDGSVKYELLNENHWGRTDPDDDEWLIIRDCNGNSDPTYGFVGPRAEENAAYIMACSPDNIIALLDLLDRLDCTGDVAT